MARATIAAKAAAPTTISRTPTTTIVATNTPGLPAVSGNLFFAHAGAGMEHVGVSDLLVPRLALLQAMSPQLVRSRSEYIDGAQPGDIVDTGTGDIFDGGVLFLPVHYRKDFIEWLGTKPGGGLVRVHSDPAILDTCRRNESGQAITASGNTIAETAQFFGLNLTAQHRRCFVPMTSTQLKKARRWMTLATGERLKRDNGSEFTAPLFYRTYLLTSAEETNAHGSWAGWKVERGKSLPEYAAEAGLNVNAIIDDVTKFRASIVKGEAKADTASMAEPAGNSSDIPF